jgi:hypothetical protein
MNRRSSSLLVLFLGAALGLAALPAAAGNPDKQWNKGCADAKAGTYDRSKKSDAYEQGWQACKQQKQSSHSSGQPTHNMQEADDYSRGCADSKAKSYDRARHNADYEAGWNACKGD